MRGRSFLYTVLIGATALVSGCANGKGPSHIRGYRLDVDAQHAVHAYFLSSIRSDFDRAMEHVFGMVDRNGDKVINNREAWDAVELIRPYTEDFVGRILAIDGKKYAQMMKLKEELSGPTIGELRREVSSTD